MQIFGYAPESNHVFALLISLPPEFSPMPRFKSINFYQNKSKIKLYLQKNKIFRVLGAPPSDCQRPPADEGGAARIPNTAPPPLQISGYAPDTRRVLLILPSFRILQ